MNGDFDAALLGGGGLMLRSTNANSNAGWQWNMPVSALEALEVPLLVFAIGYNRFEGEAEFDPVFTEHINATVEKSAFFGLRNHGSMRQLQRYLRPELVERVSYQPCPTTVASYLVPDLYVPDLEPEKRVGFQVTFEPRNELAGYRQQQVYSQLLIVAKELRRQGYELDAISHGMADDSYHGFLSDNGVAARLAPSADRGLRRAGVLRPVAPDDRHARPCPDDPVRNGQRDHLGGSSRQAPLLHRRHRPSGVGRRPARGGVVDPGSRPGRRLVRQLNDSTGGVRDRAGAPVAHVAGQSGLDQPDAHR